MSFIIHEDEWAFDLFYFVAFLVVDRQWLEKNASYMDLNVHLIFYPQMVRLHV